MYMCIYIYVYIYKYGCMYCCLWTFMLGGTLDPYGALSTTHRPN